MTVSSEVNRAGPYLGNGSTTVFGFGFRILSASHLRVIITDEDDVETDLPYPSGYSVTGVGANAGGSITISPAPATGSRITILRNVPMVQETDLENQGAYYAETIERQFDLIVMQNQQQSEELRRAVKMPVGDNEDGADISGRLASGILRLSESVTEIETVSAQIGKVVAVADNEADVSTVAENIDLIGRASGSVVSMAPASFVGDGTIVEFDLPLYTTAANSLIWVGAVRQRPGTDYTVQGRILTLNTPPADGVDVEALVISAVSSEQINQIYEEFQGGVSITKQNVITVAGQRRYSVDAAGAALSLRAATSAVFGASPFGMLTLGVDYTIDDGALLLSFDPADGELFHVVAFPRVSNSAAQVILQDFEDRVRDDADRAEAAARPFASYAAALEYALAAPSTLTRVSAIISGLLIEWVRQTGGPCLGGGWVPADEVSPQHFGAQAFTFEDQSAAVQAAIDYARNSWNASSWAFERVVDFGGKTFVCDQSIDCSGLRQPRLTIRDGAILSRAAGKIAFDACLSNSIIFDDFVVYGDAVQSPAWGIYVGRGLLNGTYPGVDGVTFMGRSGCWGHFSRGCLFAFAAEVSRMGDRTFFHNRHRSLTAVAVACVDSMGAVVRHFGSETTSDFQTLPTAATGNHSNICHDWGQTEFRRVADYNLSITSISQAAQAVVGVASGTLAAANVQVGDEVFISGGTMTEIAYGSYEVVAVGANSMTLNVDSTGFSAYTGGASLQNRTGPALLSSGMRTVSMVGAYLLTYGAPCVLFDGEGGAPYDWHVQVQFERHSDKPITFKVPTGTIVVPQFHLSSTNTSQSPKTAIIWVEGAGVVRFDGGSLRVSNMATAPSQSVMAPQAQIRANGFDIDTPRQASLPTALLEYSGRTLATDRTPRVVHHQVGLEGVRSIGLATSPTALTDLGLRWAAGGLLVYRPDVSAERKVRVQDSASTPQLNALTDRVNTTDKYAGKEVWNVSTLRPVYATGGTADAVWHHSDGTVAHTPV